MGKSKKKFIDKKNSVTFNLVHRSQRDPLVADETAPQHVLVEAADKQNKCDVEKQQEEQRKWGVFFDDEYDYLQHLRGVKDLSVTWASSENTKAPIKKKEVKAQNPEENASRLFLPSSVFASEVEEEVGMLNKAAPQKGLRLDLDPDIVAAMDEDFNYDDPTNMLEDNFMELAMMEQKQGEGEEAEGSDEEYDDDNQSQVGYASDNQWSDSEESDDGPRRMPKFDNEDAKSRFSQYSMSSSIMRRNNGLTLLDDKFEKMFAEYDDTEIGALECDEIEGHLPPTPDVLLKCAEHFHNDRRSYKLEEDKEVVRLTQLQEVSEDEEMDDEKLFGKEEDIKEKWDCESILSTYSNLYNHPRLIEEPKRIKKIKISAKTGIPLDVLHGSDSGKLTVKSLAKFNLEQAEFERAQNGDDESVAESVMTTLSILSLRPKNETPDEKKERKRLLREYRHERRIEKKANTVAFKEEKKCQDKIAVNNRNNIQGIKIV